MPIRYDSLFIGGSWVAPSSPARIDVTSSSTEEHIGSVPEAQEADVDAAVGAARRAFDEPGGWPDWEPARRGAHWLKTNQRASGRWFTRSVNGARGHSITNAGTAFAVMGLKACDVADK